jgi:hypothetical protein
VVGSGKDQSVLTGPAPRDGVIWFADDEDVVKHGDHRLFDGANDGYVGGYGM